MRKLTKKQKELLIELVKEFLETLDNSDEDEWYDTDRGFAEGVMKWFFANLGIEFPDTKE